METNSVHNTNHEATSQNDSQEDRNSTTSGASCSTGPSKGRSSAHASAPEGAEEPPHQGAQNQQLVAEGGHKQRAKQGRRRSRQPRQRSERLTFRASPTESDNIQKAADAKGVSKARFIAQAVHSELHGRPHLDQDDALDRLETARVQLVRAGNNLNQIAKVLNSGGDALHIDRASDAVAEAATEIRAAAQKLVS
ncbi:MULTISPECIES: plasmid mobilization relaxosome protein MobC [unclassified Streptomyces]|uniref:plasmid mobilization protein n=1 Tax=unclassified Streptomyces TaxID=2593676 RepID=UPI00115FC497|nr:MULTISPECIES: plasmid mobilization relaxosome protein MobC [unclassified Streptomyces]